jgi:hypothetical protein
MTRWPNISKPQKCSTNLQMWFNLWHDGPFLYMISNVIHLLYDIIGKLVLHHGEKSGMGPGGEYVIIKIGPCLCQHTITASCYLPLWQDVVLKRGAERAQLNCQTLKCDNVVLFNILRGKRCCARPTIVKICQTACWTQSKRSGSAGQWKWMEWNMGEAQTGTSKGNGQ